MTLRDDNERHLREFAAATGEPVGDLRPLLDERPTMTEDAPLRDEIGHLPVSTFTVIDRPYCLRCEVPVYQDDEGVWRREATGSQVCPRNPAVDGHEVVTPPTSTPEEA